MNFYIKFLFFYFLIPFNISADELTINLSGQNKPGILNLAIYNDAEAYNRSVKGEGRSEGGFFSGIDSFIELLDAFGVLEVMRTGRIATLRGATKVGINDGEFTASDNSDIYIADKDASGSV